MHTTVSALTSSYIAHISFQTDILVQLAALSGFQQLIIFVSAQIDIPVYVPLLQAGLGGSELILRRAAATLLRQLAQRQPELLLQYSDNLDALLFKMLDIEAWICLSLLQLTMAQDDTKSHSELKETLVTLLSSQGSACPSHWLELCNNVLSGASEKMQQVCRCFAVF
jgi:hypothetical protein